MVTPRIAPVKLSALRDIGWLLWDPIGLAGQAGGWPRDCADEYDSYLLAAASRLQRGEAQGGVVEYLVKIEIEHMGLEHSSDAKDRAEQTVAAISKYLAAE